MFEHSNKYYDDLQNEKCYDKEMITYIIIFSFCEGLFDNDIITTDDNTDNAISKK